MKKVLLIIIVSFFSQLKSQANEVLRELNLENIQLGKVYDNIQIEELTPYLFRREYTISNNANFSKAKEFFDAKKRLIRVELTINSNENKDVFFNSNLNLLSKNFGKAFFLRDTLNVRVAKFYKDYYGVEFGIYSINKKTGGNITFNVALPYIIKTEENTEKKTNKYSMFGMYQGIDSNDENNYRMTLEVFEKEGKKYPRMIIWNDLENRQKITKLYLIIDNKTEEFRTFFRLRNDPDINAEEIVTHDIPLSNDLIQAIINAKLFEIKLENSETGYYNKLKTNAFNQLGFKTLEAFLKE